MWNSVVSIIIPTFNRAQLIAETLDSIILQTHRDWECIVIDDHSSDTTKEVVKSYCEKDVRIKYFHLPAGKNTGANSARNYGLHQSKGDYIIWFDSDDLMTPGHIEGKLKKIQNRNLDFVVARTQNFRGEEMLTPYTYEKKEYGIKAADFILLKIHWYTYDVMLKRKVAEKISWNEKMKSWQDYNYFCKMLLVTENGAYLDEILTHRRLHSNSIQTALTKDVVSFKQELLDNRIFTFQDIQEQIGHKTRSELIFGMMNLCYELRKLNSFPEKIKQVKDIVRRNLGLISLILFQSSIVSAWVLKRGFFLLEKAKRR